MHPSWLLKDDPEISRGNGVWGMIRRLRQTPSEGLPSLWKGQLITTIGTLLSNLLQPQIHLALLSLAPSTPPINPDVPLTAFPSPGVPLAIGVTSHLLTQFVLSPLDILRTRIIVMPLSDPSTPSSVSLFRQMVEKEGGFGGMYFHPNLFIPTVVENTLRPLLTLSVPLLLERYFGLSPQLSPITYSLCDLSLGLASLIILLPIETVRKRLQLQNRATGGGKRIKTVVQTRERDYIGVVEAMWRIVTEETGSRRKRVMTEKDEGGVFSGIRQLYRGVCLFFFFFFFFFLLLTPLVITLLTTVRHGGYCPPHCLRPRPRQRRFGRISRWWMEGDLTRRGREYSYVLVCMQCMSATPVSAML